MKKVTLRTQAWIVVTGRGLTVLLAALCMFFWGSTAIKPLLTVTAISCFVFSMFSQRRRGLNSTSAMAKLPTPWTKSMGIPETHQLTAAAQPPVTQ